MNNACAVPDVRLEMFSQPRLLAPARALLGTLAQRFGFNELHCGQISLAIDEALCNIINHGYNRRPDGRISLSVWQLSNPAGIKVTLEDSARQVDPESIQGRDLSDIRPGGLGVHLIREIMDEVHYERREGGGMRLTMIKFLGVESRRGSIAAGPAGRAGESEEANE
jgi:anti-sigma regulatory factor (Ser/Thr protein kinase)